MSFNKSKAMRSAERFLTQGKLQAAISEYKIIVENDSKDINTINILGDLYAKCDDNKSASNCYQQVAEHYHKQGFAKKAISIYNKIYRIEPDSLEVCEKLAELYRMRGSVAEARKYYIDISKRYEEKGFRDKALEIWEILGEIDPQNADIYVKIAEYYHQDNQNENAAEAFIEAGGRFLDNGHNEDAVEAFSNALDILPKNMLAVNGFVKSQSKLGYVEEAVKKLEELAEKDLYNKEISYLLIDCYFEMDQPEKAEEVIIGIVEREPANYEKLVDLLEVYLEKDDLESTVRILSMVSEHLLIDGKTEKLSDYINEILARNPEQIETLRLQARFYGWQKDEAALQKTLERLVEVSRINESIEDERYALGQLLKLVPHDVDFSSRFKEINEQYDFDEEIVGDQLLNSNSGEIPAFENFTSLNGKDESHSSNGFKIETNGYEQDDFAEGTDKVSVDNSIEEVEFNDDVEGKYRSETDKVKGFDFINSTNETDFTAEVEQTNLTLSNEREIEDEVESIKFYIEQGYTGLAEKSLEKLENNFGKTSLFNDLRKQIDGKTDGDAVEQKDSEVAEIVELTSEMLVIETADEQAESEENNHLQAIKVEDEVRENNDFEDFRDDLELEENTETKSADDYENHYHFAVAYQEMGLMENAIREYQDAANCVEINDGTRRFFQCCNLLGHCFMEKNMPHLALIWLEKALETDDLNEDEKQGLNYEIANAYQLNGESDKARELFEQIYSIDVDYRDVSEHLKNLNKELIAQ